MAIESGKQLLHYRLIEKIGKGGMGEVYIARDSKLNRNVALKVLPSETEPSQHRDDLFSRGG